MSEKEPDSLCSELKTLLRHELESGNCVLAVETGWSRVKLAVRLTRPLDLPFVKKAAEKNSHLEIWESRDIKNPQETGVLCKKDRHTLSGPIK
jgi:hypothetical protein